MTDANGEFHVPHAATGIQTIRVDYTNFVSQRVTFAPGPDGASVTAPDVVLHVGGWISGRIVLPKDAPRQVEGTVNATIQGDLPADPVVYPVASILPDGSFRIGPLPRGAYTLSSQPHYNPWWARGMTNDVKVEPSQETSNVLLPVSTPTAQTQTNR